MACGRARRLLRLARAPILLRVSHRHRDRTSVQSPARRLLPRRASASAAGLGAYPIWVIAWV